MGSDDMKYFLLFLFCVLSVPAWPHENSCETYLVETASLLDPQPLLELMDAFIEKFEGKRATTPEEFAAALARLSTPRNPALASELMPPLQKLFSEYDAQLPHNPTPDAWVNLQASNPADRQRLKATKEFIAGSSLEGFRSSQQIYETLREYAETYPHIAQLVSLGRTHEQRDLWALEITDTSVPAEEKPVLVFDSLIHPVEIMTGEVTMDIAYELVSRHGFDPEVRDWLQNYRIFIIPVMNPDGYARVHAGDSGWRKNTYVRNGAVYGVDLNRNFPTHWEVAASEPNASHFRGDSPASEPETRALMRFGELTKPLANLSYHTSGETLVYPYGRKGAQNEALELFHDVGRAVTAELPNVNGGFGTWRVGTAPEIYYEVGGGSCDWLWRTQGTLAFVLELLDFQTSVRPEANLRPRIIGQQRAGWKNFIRRMGQNAVRARVVDAPAREGRVTYAFVAKPGDLPTKFYSLRNDAGLLYGLIPPGQRTLQIWQDQRVARAMELPEESGVIDLGEIHFQR